MPLIVVEQSASQQRDQSIINVMFANVTTVCCFRTGNHVDEELMLDQFSPKVEKGDIPNLSRYHFYIKISAVDSEDPFSGVTIKQNDIKDQKVIDLMIKSSRDNWGVEYVKPVKDVEPENDSSAPANENNLSQAVKSKAGLPRPRKT